MLKFREGKIVVAKLDASGYEKGEIATIVKYPEKKGMLNLKFKDGFGEYSFLSVEQVESEHFDFYEKQP